MKIARILIVIVVVSVASGFFTAQASNLSQFNHLMEPQIIFKKNQEMLVVEAEGDPNIIGEKAFGLLFQLYYVRYRDLTKLQETLDDVKEAIGISPR